MNYFVNKKKRLDCQRGANKIDPFSPLLLMFMQSVNICNVLKYYMKFINLLGQIAKKLALFDVKCWEKSGKSGEQT